jgi:hypothetical protein
MAFNGIRSLCSLNGILWQFYSFAIQQSLIALAIQG